MPSKEISLSQSLLLSVAILLVSFMLSGSCGLFSTGHTDQIPAPDVLYFVMGTIAVLHTGVRISEGVYRLKIYNDDRNYLHLLVYSSVMALGLGSPFFLPLSIGFLIVIECLYLVLSASYNEVSMSSSLFQIVLIIFLLSLWSPKLIWLIPVLMLMAACFRQKSRIDILIIVLSLVSVIAIALWFGWYFDGDLVKFTGNYLHQAVGFSLPDVDFSIPSIVAAVLVVLLTLLSLIELELKTPVTSNLSLRVIAFFFLLFIVSTPLLFLLNGKLDSYTISVYACSLALVFPLSIKRMESGFFIKFYKALFFISISAVILLRSHACQELISMFVS